MSWFYLKFSKRDSHLGNNQCLFENYIWREWPFLSRQRRVLRLNNSLGLLSIFLYVYTCRRISPRTSELTNPIAAPGRCSKPTTGLFEVQSEKKEGSEKEEWEETSWGREREEGPVPIEQGGFEKRGKSKGAPLQIEWRRRPDGFIVGAIESTNTATTNRLSRENATRAGFD